MRWFIPTNLDEQLKNFLIEQNQQIMMPAKLVVDKLWLSLVKFENTLICVIKATDLIFFF